MSCSNAAQQSTVSCWSLWDNASRLCSHTSYACRGWYCWKPCNGCISGNRLNQIAGYAANVAAAYGAVTMRSHSERIRSADTHFKNDTVCFIAAAVSGWMVSPYTAANRTARKIRRASSVNRSVGTPTHRSCRFCKSAAPWKGSMIPVSGWYAIALMVKSRRCKSVCSESANCTASGWRWSW